MKKRIFSLLLALCLVAGMLPTVAYANTIGGITLQDAVPGTVYLVDFTSSSTTTPIPPTYNSDNRINNLLLEGTDGTIMIQGEGTAYYHDGTHGLAVFNDNCFNIAVAGDAEITFCLCAYSNSGYLRATVDEGKGVFNEESINLKGLTDGAEDTFYYTGEATTIKVTISGCTGESYLHSIKVTNKDNVTVTFNSDGGSTVDEQKVLRGHKATAPTDPTRAGYSFEGWYKGDTEFDFANTPVTEDITLTAKWSIVWTELTKAALESTYKVYSLGSYDYILPSGNYYLGEDISVDITVCIGDYGTPTQNVVLELNGYELRRDNNGALLFLRDNSTLNLIDSSSTKTGKVINSSGDTIFLGSNTNLNANGGTIDGNVDLHGENAVIDNTDPSNVTVFREGQIYGSSPSAGINGGIFYSTVGPVNSYSGQITGGIFYGTVNCGKIRESAKVTVAFNSDGNTVTEQKVLRGQKASAPTEPTKASYSFNGWYNGNTEFDFANTPVIENITLTVKWTPKTYHVTLNTNGADSCAELTEYTYGIGATLPTPVKAGYTFSGWYVANDFSGAAVTNIITTDTENKTFYAKWVEKSDISFNTAPQSYTYDDSAQAFSITGTAVIGFDISYQQNGQIVTTPTDAGSYDVIITRAEDNTYKAVDVTISGGLVINPATPTENPAKKTTARVVRGRTLADATVTNGEIFAVDGITPLTGTFVWVDSTKTMSADGTEQMVFTPNNTNYTPITINVAVSTYTTGGGGSYMPNTYTINIESTKNGTVTMNPKSASKGTTVTLTVTPDKGYTLETLTVLDSSNKEIKLTEKNGNYTFTMPASKITVKATFMEDNTMLNFFVDIPTEAYYYDAVLWAVENGITSGTDAVHFSPNAPCTRAQIITFLWRAAGSPKPKTMSNFADVTADTYYTKAVSWAVENGITTGTGDGKFSPNGTCNRAQAMTFIYRSEQANGGGLTGGWMFLNPFEDVNLENYYGEAVMWAIANGVTNGTTDSTFSPDNNCTRAQIITFLHRFYEEVKNG